MSDWIRWSFSEEFHISKYSHGISFTLKKCSRVCTVDTIEDYRNLMKKYSKRKYPEGYFSGSLGNERVIDFEKLSNDFDAFHLTENGFWTMRMPWTYLLDDEGNRMADFYSYDCETWIMFNLDCINKGSIFNHSIRNPFS